MSCKFNYNINRRNFIKMTTAATFSAGIIGCSRKAKKPNILFIWTDEQRADTMEVYGNRKIHSPNLNRLASESVVFENAYVSQPVCTPSRSTVLTGLWPHTSGCTENNIPLPATIPCLPELTNDPDYRTGYFGKWHLGDEIFAQHGFEEWVSMEDGYWPYYNEGKDKTKPSDYTEFLKSLGYTPDTDRGTFSRGFAARLPLEHCKPKFLEQKACDFITRHQREPFILHINFLEPHMPFYGPLNDEHQPDEIDLPKNFDDPLEINEPLRYRLIRERYSQNGYNDFDLKTEQGWHRLIMNYWGLVSQVDLSVGAILTKLEELGLADNTMVVYTSDHGDMMGAHHLLAKTVMYEESVKVPWLMRIPWLGRTQRLLKGRFSHIDLMPTLLNVINRSDAAKGLPGRSLLPNIQGNIQSPNDVFIEWNPAIQRGKPIYGLLSVSEDEAKRVHESHTRTVITQDGWKLCLRDKDKNQLFNLNNDPYEERNLYGDSQFKKIIGDLNRKIVEWQKNVGDSVDFESS
jgi:arylsulfatase A-like enzyme